MGSDDEEDLDVLAVEHVGEILMVFAMAKWRPKGDADNEKEKNDDKTAESIAGLFPVVPTDFASYL